jgi:hypothetical protein
LHEALVSGHLTGRLVGEGPFQLAFEVNVGFLDRIVQVTGDSHLWVPFVLVLGSLRVLVVLVMVLIGEIGTVNIGAKQKC